MNTLLAFTLFLGVALAAPQYYPAPAYKPVHAYAGPAYKAYAAPAFKAYAAPAYHAYAAPAYKAYAAPEYAAPAYKPIHAYAAPQYSAAYKPIAILRMSSEDNYDGTFSYDFESENGIAVQSSGYLKPGVKEPIQVAQGSYSYTSPDGTPITTRWFADESGFHAEGAHLPVPPPLPEAIAKSLNYQASQPPSVEYN